MYGYTADKEARLARLRQIEGWCAGCSGWSRKTSTAWTALTQVSAVTRALQSVALGLMEDHLGHCVARESPRAARWRPRRSARRLRPSPAWSGPETGNCGMTSAGYQDARGHCVHSVTGKLTNLGEVSDARRVVLLGPARPRPRHHHRRAEGSQPPAGRTGRRSTFARRLLARGACSPTPPSARSVPAHGRRRRHPQQRRGALLFYLRRLRVAKVAAFAVVTELRTPAPRPLSRLAARHPGLAAVLVVGLLGLIGPPPTAVSSASCQCSPPPSTAARLVRRGGRRQHRREPVLLPALAGAAFLPQPGHGRRGGGLGPGQAAGPPSSPTPRAQPSLPSASPVPLPCRS